MYIKKLGVILCMAFGLCACCRKDVVVQEENITKEEVTQENWIVIPTEGTEVNDLFVKDFEIETLELQMDEGSILDMARNSSKVFFVKVYVPDGGITAYRCQVVQVDIESREKQIVYDTEASYWMNELLANEEYVYWIEYKKIENNTEYQVMEYDIQNETIQEIASRKYSEVYDFGISLSEEYLSWYDDSEQGASIVVYDIDKKEFLDTSAIHCTKYMPYERPKIVDNKISYFSEDEEENVSINVYDISSGTSILQEIGERRKLNKIAGCYSDGRYLGWYSDYGEATHYIYDTLLGKQYSLQDMYVFTACIKDGSLYISDSVNSRVWRYNFEKEEMVYQTFEDYPVQFLLYENDIIYFEQSPKVGKMEVMISK